MPSLATYADKLYVLVYPISDNHADDILAHYYRRRLSSEWIAEFNAMAELPNDQAVTEMCRMFCSVTAKWNMTETDEPDAPMVPLTVAATRNLGLTLIRGLLSGYIEAIQDPEVVESVPSQPLPTLLPSPRKGSMAS